MVRIWLTFVPNWTPLKCCEILFLLIQFPCSRSLRSLITECFEIPINHSIKMFSMFEVFIVDYKRRSEHRTLSEKKVETQQYVARLTNFINLEFVSLSLVKTSVRA